MKRRVFTWFYIGIVCFSMSVGMGADWTMSYPGTSESFGVNTNVPGYGDAPQGGLQYTFRFRKSGTTIASKTRTTTYAGYGRGHWENIYVNSTTTYALEPVGSPPAWPCGAAEVDIWYNGAVQVSKAIDITSSGCDGES